MCDVEFECLAHHAPGNLRRRRQGAVRSTRRRLSHPVPLNPFLAPAQEKHFFDTDDYLSKDGLANYLKEFKNCKNLYTIDSTPRYIQEEVVPGRLVSSYAPSDLRKKRFVLTLREPTARQYSEYQVRSLANA